MCFLLLFLCIIFYCLVYKVVVLLNDEIGVLTATCNSVVDNHLLSVGNNPFLEITLKVY